MMLDVNGVVSTYGDTEILHNVSMELPRGKSISLIGRNGAGKSTLFKTIYGLLKPKSGMIRYKDKEIQHLPPHRIKDLGISYMPQGAKLFPHLTVEENIRCLTGKEQTYDLAFERLRNIFLDGISKRDSYIVRMVDSLLGAHKDQVAGTLSGGQRQVVCLVRSLIYESDLLMWDEPSIGLSHSLLPELHSLMQYLTHSGKTILLIDQRIEWLLHATDYVFVMQKGEIKYAGGPEHLLKDRARLLALLGLEFTPNGNRSR